MSSIDVMLKETINKKWAYSQGEKYDKNFMYFISSICILVCVDLWYESPRHLYFASPVLFVILLSYLLAVLPSSDWYCRFRTEREFSLKRKKSTPLVLIKTKVELTTMQVCKALDQFKKVQMFFSELNQQIKRKESTVVTMESAKKGDIFSRIFQTMLVPLSVSDIEKIEVYRTALTQIAVRLSQIEHFFEENQKMCLHIFESESLEVDEIENLTQYISSNNWEKFPVIGIDGVCQFYGTSEFNIRLELLETMIKNCEQFIEHAETVQ